MRRFIKNVIYDPSLSFVLMITIVSIISVTISACARTEEDKRKSQQTDRNRQANVISVIKAEFPNSRIYAGVQNRTYIVVQGEKVFYITTNCSCEDIPKIVEIEPKGEY